MVKKYFRPALTAFAALTIICGVCYPLLVTIASQAIFPRQANGSLIVRDGKVAGSALIGQPFSDPKYFWSRPSSTTPAPYNAASSAASNLGPSNPALTDRVRASVEALRNADPSNTSPIPADLVTSSASGLDPHISVAAALWQVPRIARTRSVSVEALTALVSRFTEERQWGLLGERRVNVLRLNLALDGLSQHHRVQ